MFTKMGGKTEKESKQKRSPTKTKQKTSKAIGDLTFLMLLIQCAVLNGFL